MDLALAVKAHRPRLYRHHRARFLPAQIDSCWRHRKVTKDETWPFFAERITHPLLRHTAEQTIAAGRSTVEIIALHRDAEAIVFCQRRGLRFKLSSCALAKLFHLESVNRVWAFGGWMALNSQTPGRCRHQAASRYDFVDSPVFWRSGLPNTGADDIATWFSNRL